MPEIANMRTVADLGVNNIESVVIATRGERLALTRTRASGGGQRPEVFGVEMLNIVEIDADNRFAAAIQFDPDDFDAAFAELDARYLAGEAAPYSQTWTAMTQVQSVYNRHELPPTTKDSVATDHRRGRAFAPDDVIPFLRASYDVAPNLKGHIEAVHRLNNFGAVITEVMTGTSQEGFDAEWREIGLFAFDGELISRFELFDEADLDAAIARFDELYSRAPRLENATIRACERLFADFATGDWDAVRETLADDFSQDDRRRVVGAGVRHGRDDEIADLRAIADLWTGNAAPTYIATRGERLALMRLRFSLPNQGNEAFLTEGLGLCEINAEERIVAAVSFDPDDIDAAFEELDARYLVGEAAAHSDAWSVIAKSFAGFNRHELPPTTHDPVYIDHRPLVSSEGADLAASLRAMLDLTSTVSVYVEAVHRLSDLGAVTTFVLTGTWQESSDVEARMVAMFTVDRDLISGVEVFDEADLDVALAKFEALQPQTRRLENAVSQVGERFLTHFVARDWEAMAGLLADDYSSDDRRRVVGAGLRRGRDAQIADMRAIADLWITNVKMTVIATRGERLALTRTSFSSRHHGSESFLSDVLDVAEIDANGRYLANVSFDPDDIDAAFEELDTRYLAGEAAAYSQTWSRTAESYAAVNRHQLYPTTADFVNVDHRRGIAFAPGDMLPYIEAAWAVTPDIKLYIEAVHRLSKLGAVITAIGNGTSPEGFDAEWRFVHLLTFQGEQIDRGEFFDETDLDAAIARFEEFEPPARLLQNAASAAHARLTACVAARDWNALSEILADDIAIDDRRRVVNSGITRGRDAAVANMSGVIEVGLTNVSSTVIATRGDRLDLCRTCVSGQDRPEAFQIEFLSVVEIDADQRIVARVLFDPEDIDSAFEELDARYIAGEAAPCARTWSAMARTCAVFNQGELPATTPDSVFVDHRPVLTVDAADLPSYLRAMWDVTPDIRVEIEAVHRLSELGAVVTHVVNSTSPEGFNAEWRGILIYTLEADMVNRCEVFDETDLEAALARFKELHREAPENPADER